MTLHLEWVDDQREPQQPPDPRYPNGIDLDMRPNPDAKSCFTFVRPYPAPRCGWFVIKCDVCGLQAIATTAGRADDPRSVRVWCKGN